MERPARAVASSSCFTQTAPRLQGPIIPSAASPLALAPPPSSLSGRRSFRAAGGRSPSSSPQSLIRSESISSLVLIGFVGSGLSRNMAGKSKGGKTKGKAPGTSQAVSAEPEVPVTDGAEVVKAENGEVSEPPAAEAVSTEVEKGDEEAAAAAQPAKRSAEGELHLYPVPVKTQSGEKLELQLSPGDSVIDVKQFLLDAPETCFYTCYDLILNTKDGSTHQLEDYNEISEIADITCGGCSLEMVSGIYDERSIRSHLRRVRELLSLSSLHVSLSTSLALQQESAQEKSADAGKTTIQELDGLNFMEDTTGALTNLLTSAPAEIKCVDSIIFSSFNPPPSYRRLHGDLVYIDVVTLEGNKYCITGNSRSFYVNRSNGNILDPRPTKQVLEASTLVGLLQKISAKFKKGFREVLDRRASAHPFENVQSLLPVTSWLGAYPVPDHKRDAARAEDSVVLSYGTELIGMQRDWNEELQSCREFPHGNPQERILRGRALYKVTCDFVDAAVKGAVGVINRCIPPINPTDPECFHMYVHNNIFFSFAVDSDYEHISKDQKPDCKNGSSKSTKVSSPAVGAKPDKNHAGSCEAANSKPEEPHIVSDDASAEAQLADSEQATYASANNDLKGTKAYQEADISGLYNLAMAIVDYRGHRVVAQSIIPGILQGDKSDSLLYGSVDNGKKISWNESFHSKVVEAAKRLHLKEHVVLDGSGNPVKLAATVECKGIVGSDDRHYILDLMRVTPRDSNYIGQEHRFCVLRPELISSFVEAESTKESLKQKAPDASEESDDQVASTSDSMATSVEGDDKSAENAAPRPAESDSSPEILFNPNVFTEYKLAGSPEEIAADEELVKKAGTYLVDVVIPKFVQDLCSLDISPMDGQSLTDALHLHGINVRYLGKPASTKGSVSITQSENQKGHENSQTQISSKVKKLSQGAARKDLSAYSPLTSDSVWSKIKEFTKYKYQFDVPDEARLGANRVVVLRNLCQKVGITIAARKYDLDASTLFQPSDILNLQPVIKHSVPTCTDARNLMEAGKIRMAEGTLNEAYALFSEAFSLLQQITGPMHKDAANCCRYGNMALFYHGLNQTELALRHMSRTLLLLSLASGPNHPDVAATLINVAMMYQDAGNMNTALRYLQEALMKNERLLGPDHIQTAVCYHALAIAFNCMGAYKLSIQVNAQKQKGQGPNPSASAIDFLKKNPAFLQAMKAAVIQSGDGSANVNRSLNSAVVGEGVPRVRGVDERAARATAEARKKAAARGVSVRNGPSNNVSELDHILNLINSAAAASSAQKTASEGQGSNGSALNGTTAESKDADSDGQSAKGSGSAPVGLGASLESKKQKSKKT
ncbi:hypothetical protein PR202_gb09568 [Eleusine coracana subsp. coracana]|uniref:Clu domain-containing protein n=1 Tax=Eleusine coracana subsp. coracana TaxID=191504 RepID=A0AAV5EHP0_ELECO|nr:hypothetical protein PR202_gb09568 [Eleusine coracana subsp. coracana]